MNEITYGATEGLRKEEERREEENLDRAIHSERFLILKNMLQ